jgi:hypothetical protein
VDRPRLAVEVDGRHPEVQVDRRRPEVEADHHHPEGLEDRRRHREAEVEAACHQCPVQQEVWGDTCRGFLLRKGGCYGLRTRRFHPRNLRLHLPQK